MAQVTAAWQRRDTPRAFVRSLEDMGYILATGTRDYVLVDLLRQHEQPAQADRRQESPDQGGAGIPRARTFRRTPCRPWTRRGRWPPAHRAAMELFSKGEERAAREAKEQQRREELQRKQQTPPPCCRAGERRRWPTGSGRPAISIQSSRRRIGRNSGKGICRRAGASKSTAPRNRPKGLAAFLGRITGVELITKKIQQYRDATRYGAFLAQKKELAERQQREAAAFERQQALETLTMQRRLRALELVEQRERVAGNCPAEGAPDRRAGTDRTPAATRAGPRPHTDEFNKAAKKPIDLTAEFERAAGSGEGRRRGVRRRGAGPGAGSRGHDPAAEADEGPVAGG